MNIEELLKRLSEATYTSYYDKEAYEHYIINRDNMQKVKEIVMTWAAEQKMITDYAKEIGRLEAKVYAYEQIIANSNFATMIVKDDRVEPQESEEEQCGK